MDKRKAIEIIIKDKTYYLFNHINMESIQNKEVNDILNLYQDHNKNIEENIQNNIFHLIMEYYDVYYLKELFDEKGEWDYYYIIGNSIFVRDPHLRKTEEWQGPFYGNESNELREGDLDDPYNRLYYYIIEGTLKNKDSIEVIDQITLDELKDYETGNTYYDLLSWKDLHDDTIYNLIILGYDEKSWDEDEDVSTSNLSWDELTPEQQNAAKALDYNKESWNKESNENKETESGKKKNNLIIYISLGLSLVLILFLISKLL